MLQGRLIGAWVPQWSPFPTTVPVLGVGFPLLLCLCLLLFFFFWCLFSPHWTEGVHTSLFFLRRNYSVCRYRSHVYVGGDGFRLYLCCHCGPPPKILYHWLLTVLMSWRRSFYIEIIRCPIRFVDLYIQFLPLVWLSSQLFFFFKYALLPSLSLSAFWYTH